MRNSLQDITGPVRKISPILEIRADNYQHLRLICGSSRGESLKHVLEQQNFGGTEILWASNPHIPSPQDICEVSHFGHSVSCDGNCHGGGVYRLFEIEILIPEDASVISETWKVGDGIELRITHSGPVVSNSELQKLPSGDPEVGRIGRDYSSDAGSEEEGELNKRTTSIGLTGGSSHQGTISSF
ncbi:hypothetical protein [Haloarcula sp. Atlit-7R]|uniref:hypothetical protein n=1 Tax=Haloarcula sp. Atlit-7R TaxID=2282125 RepID=UPI0011C48E08|nr:hypothetical protein [Haloarcula sp. Atlit-7R]